MTPNSKDTKNLVEEVKKKMDKLYKEVEEQSTIYAIGMKNKDWDMVEKALAAKAELLDKIHRILYPYP